MVICPGHSIQTKLRATKLMEWHYPRGLRAPTTLPSQSASSVSLPPEAHTGCVGGKEEAVPSWMEPKSSGYLFI